MEVEKQLNGKGVDKDVNFDKDLIPNLTRKSNRLFESLKNRQLITEKRGYVFLLLVLENLQPREIVSAP